MELRCSRCGYLTPEELGFCLKCRAALVPKNAYDLNPIDYEYGPDRDAIRNIKVIGPLPYLLKNLAVGNFEKNLLLKLAHEAYRAAYPSDLDTIARHCASLLSLETLPEIFIIRGEQPNAFTFGLEKQPYVVLDSNLVRMLTQRELMTVLGHELGHVKSGHMLYHTLGEILSRGLNLSASLLGLDILSIPIRLALLSWHRESEVTADRASLLVVHDVNIVVSLMTKLEGSHRPSMSTFGGTQKRDVGMLESLSELLRTHPLHENRLTLVKRFAESPEFFRARAKIEQREKLRRALIPVCRFCFAAKPVVDLFCPICGRSQI